MGRFVMLAILATSCACGGTTPPAPTPPVAAPVAVASLMVSGAAPIVGETAQLAATATLTNGATEIVTSQATWASSNTAVAGVSSTGLATGVAAGEADITATYRNVAGRTHLTIVQPQVPTYTVAVTVTDGTSGGLLRDMHVESRDSVGKLTAANTGNDGAYSIGGLPAGPATITASGNNYETTTTAITISSDLRVDVVLPRTAPCAYTIDRSLLDQALAPGTAVPASGGLFTIAVVRRTGRCAWRAAPDVPWIKIAETTGDNSATIHFTVSEFLNELFPRQGVISVTWQGGQADARVSQSQNCRYSLPPAQSLPAEGGSTRVSLTPGMTCAFTYSSDASWLSLSRTNTTVTVFAAPNTSTAARTGAIRFSWPGGGGQMSVVQGGATR